MWVQQRGGFRKNKQQAAAMAADSAAAAMQVRCLLSLCFYMLILGTATEAIDLTQKKPAAAAAAAVAPAPAAAAASNKPSPAPSVSQTPSPKPAAIPTAPASSPTSSAASSPAPAAAPATAPSAPTFSNASLDPGQLAALRSLGVPIEQRDLCAPSPNSPLVCDQASPSRHLVSLELRYCPAEAVLTKQALDSLATSLKSLAFLHCPTLKPVPFPPEFTSSLESLSIVSSLGPSDTTTTGEDTTIAGEDAITGVWLGKFHRLGRLEVRDVVLNASGLPIVLANMTALHELTIANASLGGRLPRSWPANLTTLNLSGNRIQGALPSFFGQLRRLESMDLSGNNVTGHLPESLGHLRTLQRLVLSQNSFEGSLPQSIVNMTALSYLDFSGNRLNGSFPEGIAGLSNLRYVDLRDNDLQGMLPFNTSFLAGLNSFKITGNPSLCYNKLVTSPKMAGGLAECDQLGNPIVPSAGGGGPAAGGGASDGSSSDSGGAQQHHGSSSSSSSSHKSSGGPKKIVWAVATALGAIFLFIAILVAVSKWCKYNKG